MLLKIDWMIEALISSKTRIKLLLKFFLNSGTRAYLRNLEVEFGESTNGIRLELNRLEEAGMLSSALDGNKKVFRANTKHPLFGEIHQIVMKYVGLDQVIESVVEKLGEVERVYLTGEFAQGRNSQIIDLIFIGNLDKNYLIELIEKVEKLIGRKIRFLVFTEAEVEDSKWLSQQNDPLLLWSANHV